MAFSGQIDKWFRGIMVLCNYLPVVGNVWHALFSLPIVILTQSNRTLKIASEDLNVVEIGI